MDCADIFTLGGQSFENAGHGGSAVAEELLTKTNNERLGMEIHRYSRYFEWAAFGLLVCPSELQRQPSLVEMLRVILSESLLMGIHGDVDVYLHQQYQTHGMCQR